MAAIFDGKRDIGEIRRVVMENVEWTFGDWPEGHGISSSDVRCCVRSVIRDLGLDPENEAITVTEFDLLETAVRNHIR